MYAEILAIGDEITSGQTLDTNSQWLSQRLEELGVRVLYHATVGDELEPGVAVFRQAAERADIVIATGGLGPTADDLTREALAEAAGRELVLIPEALEHIRCLFAQRNREMPKQNELQAMFPAGSRMIENPNGTAPGIDLEISRVGRDPCRFFALPGVPAEMVEMWNGYLRDEIKNLAGDAKKIVRRRINCFGAGESQLEAMLPDMIRRGRVPTVGITASKATISLRIAAEGSSEEECNRLIEPTVKIIYDSLGELVFGEGDEELQDAVVRLLLEKRQTLAVVEWGIGGLVTQWLSDVPEAENCFIGGVVVPNRKAMKRYFALDFGDNGSTSSDEIVDSIRNQLKADWLLMVGGFQDSSDDTPSPAYLAIGNAVQVKTKTIPFGIHPALRNIFLAKHSLNLARLTLMGK